MDFREKISASIATVEPGADVIDNGQQREYH